MKSSIKTVAPVLFFSLLLLSSRRCCAPPRDEKRILSMRYPSCVSRARHLLMLVLCFRVRDPLNFSPCKRARNSKLRSSNGLFTPVRPGFSRVRPSDVSPDIRHNSSASTTRDHCFASATPTFLFMFVFSASRCERATSVFIHVRTGKMRIKRAHT